MLQNNINQIWQNLENTKTEKQPFTQDVINNLPEPVQRYFLHAITLGTPLATGVKLKMQGYFQPSKDKKLPMQATEILTAKGFVWQAVMGNKFFNIKGADYYYNNSAKVEFKIWGLIPLVKEENPDINRSSIGRFAGELFWLPSALLPQNQVSLQAIDHNTIQATFNIEGETVNLTFIIDENGRVLEVKLPRWGNQTTYKSWQYIPFGGTFSQETSFQGYTIPSQINAGWWLGSEQYNGFFQASIEEAEFF
ncbi:DUF6544 family protein [Sphaerospermopsis sp. FACHB-1194]|uniref:DUF6920 family protein n=1 Tax=Sphaerospermopsis sp. FACHB-1194 TaxID=2692862 RepID=UPI0018EFCD0F|nr:DUF6544 family protein [Sphaerospermopsis sp. FACHB-1194]